MTTGLFALESRLPQRQTNCSVRESRLLQVDFTAFKRKSRSKKQTKHRAAKRKARRTSQRTSEVMKKIAPGLDEDSHCEKSHSKKRASFQIEQKREKKWLELLICQHNTTRLNSDARDYLLSLLGKNGGDAATRASSYYGNGNPGDVGDDDRYDDDDDCSVLEAASRISPEQNSSDENYGPYWDNSPFCTPYLDHVSD